MQITRENIAPYLDTPIPSGSETKVDSWLAAINARLSVTFGNALPSSIAPAVYDIVALAVQRRMSRGAFDPRIRSQATGPSSVTYNTDVTALVGWFFPAEIADLATLFGAGGNVSSTRTPAPDGVRYGNLYDGRDRVLAAGIELPWGDDVYPDDWDPDAVGSNS